jgi:hypothetical protein
MEKKETRIYRTLGAFAKVPNTKRRERLPAPSGLVVMIHPGESKADGKRSSNLFAKFASGKFSATKREDGKFEIRDHLGGKRVVEFDVFDALESHPDHGKRFERAEEAEKKAPAKRQEPAPTTPIANGMLKAKE